MLLALMCSLKLMRLMRLMQLMRLMRLMQPQMLIMQVMRLRLARSVVLFAARTALPAGALSTAKIKHARHTGRAYLIPRLINWCQLVSLMPLYLSFPCTPYPGPVSWPCSGWSCFLVTSLGHGYFSKHVRSTADDPLKARTSQWCVCVCGHFCDPEILSTLQDLMASLSGVSMGRLSFWEGLGLFVS